MAQTAKKRTTVKRARRARGVIDRGTSEERMHQPSRVGLPIA
jgi:hypothetical protein